MRGFGARVVLTQSRCSNGRVRGYADGLAMLCILYAWDNVVTGGMCSVTHEGGGEGCERIREHVRSGQIMNNYVRWSKCF